MLSTRIISPRNPTSTTYWTITDPTVPKRCPYNRLVFLLGSLSILGPLAIDMYLPGFPAISVELGAQQSAVQGTVVVYFIGLAIGQIFYGPIADRLGRKRPLYFGLMVFILATVACAFVKSVEMLIVLRFVQALGGCAEMVIGRAVVRDLLGERDSARAYSFLLFITGSAAIVSPLIGGQLLHLFGWRSIFWLVAGFASLCLCAVALLLPESLRKEQRRRHGFMMILEVYGTLIKHRPFMAYTLSGSLMIAGMFAYSAASPFILITLFGVSPGRYGLFFGTNALGLILATQINGKLVRRVNATNILHVVLTITSVAGFLLLVSAVTGKGEFFGILVPLFLFVASLGFILPNTAALAMSPHGHVAGSASALIGAMQFFCGAGASALVGKLNNGTAVPIALVIAGCGGGAFLVYQLFARRPVLHDV